MAEEPFCADYSRCFQENTCLGISYLQDLHASQDYLEPGAFADTSSFDDQITECAPDNGTTFCSAALQQPQTSQKPESAAAREPSRPRRKRNREVNRRAQRRFREKNKNQLHTLKGELAEAHQALVLLQSKNDQQANALSILRTQACSDLPFKSHINWQGTDELDYAIARNVMPVWHSGKAYTCTVSAEQADAMQQVSKASPQHVAILWQKYIKQMAAALQATSVDMDTPEGLHLRQVVDEYSCIHAIAARVDPAHHMALVANAVNAYAGNSSAPNYREAVPLMQLSLAQEVSLLAMRHIFITQLGLITQRRQQLAQQLHNGPQTVGISQEEMLDAHLARKACLQHLQDCQTLERKLSVQYFIAVCHGVLTTRQCAMYKVYAYPQFFDVIAAMNAVAESVGEHSVVEVAAQAVANASRGTRVELLGEPFEFDKRQVSGVPSSILEFERSQPASTIAEEAVQTMSRTLEQDLSSQSIFGA